MKHSVLIIDDDKLITNTMEKRFSSFDMEVFTAKSSEEAKQIMEKYTPDAVILDLLLTTEDGSMDILDFMKGRPPLANVPVIVLTNLDKPELKETMSGLGVKEFLVKGQMSLDDIYERILFYIEPKNPSAP